MDPSSLSHHKSSFLTTQIRLLSAPLVPSSAFTSSLHSSTTSDLSSKTIEEVVSKINEKIKSHTRLVFSAQTQRHIVEQIESLYFAEALAEDDGQDEEGEELVAVERDRDLTASEVARGLPEELQQCMLRDVSDLGMDEDEAERYAELRARLMELSETRDRAREKLERYRKLQELLRPFEDPQSRIQPNLVTRDGEMGKELERMRVLLARVMGRMGEVDSLLEKQGEERGNATFEDKLKEAMELT